MRLRGQRNGSCSGERLRQPREHHKVGVKADALQAASPKRGKRVVVLQAPKLSFNGSAAPVEVFPSLSVASDAREQPTAESKREGGLVGLRGPHARGFRPETAA